MFLASDAVGKRELKGMLSKMVLFTRARITTVLI